MRPRRFALLTRCWCAVRNHVELDAARFAGLTGRRVRRVYTGLF